MIAFCTDKRRRDRVLRTPGLNGIDYVEVVGRKPGCGKTLALTFLKDARNLSLAPENVSLTGHTTLVVAGIASATDSDPITVTISLDATGDFSPYSLSLVVGPLDPDPPPGIDPQLSSVTFSFKAGCPSPVDCAPTDCCPSIPMPAPDIHYLARDYDGFRQAMLDRLSVLLPTWTETHAADPGIALVEALAFAADRASYLQDAVNTEAYIGTARSRISLRRHARLVDYRVAEGANARTWMCLAASADGVSVPHGTQFHPLFPGLGPSVDPDSYDASKLKAASGPVFASMEPTTLRVEQNKMEFYSWGDGGCCLPAGSTDATLTGAFSSLKAGQVLIFEELLGPKTGDPADADPNHRWAVRLTWASTVDHAGNPLVDPTNPGIALTAISWQDADALPFSLCLSSVTDPDHGSVPLAAVSVARGNVVAADHGVWTVGESLGAVPPAPEAPVAGAGCDCGTVTGAAIPHPRFDPILANPDLTFAVPYVSSAAASTFLSPDTSAAKPQVCLESDDGGRWQPVQDLLGLVETNQSQGFVPEIENDGTAHLRFGDGIYGAAPEAGLSFLANYRTGNGTAGNVGREALAHALFHGPGIAGVRNPLAAAGGTDREAMEHIRQVAPFAFQTQERCVTADDYGTMAALVPGVREAKGTVRWTGSWYSAFTSIDPQAVWTPALGKAVTSNLNRLRMMGVDLVVERAVFVGLRIALEICVDPGYFRGDVYAAVWAALVGGDTCAGTPGLLNAVNFRFGETVYSSPVVAAAQAVVGVVSVKVLHFERMDSPTPDRATPPTRLTMGAVEVPRCDNDPNHADRGVLLLTMDGGK